jgi:hypothetical protein
MKTIISPDATFCDISGYEIVKRYISKIESVRYFCLFYRFGISDSQQSVSIKPECIDRFRKILSSAWETQDVIDIGGIMKEISDDEEDNK